MLSKMEEYERNYPPPHHHHKLMCQGAMEVGQKHCIHSGTKILDPQRLHRALFPIYDPFLKHEQASEPGDSGAIVRSTMSLVRNVALFE